MHLPIIKTILALKLTKLYQQKDMYTRNFIKNIAKLLNIMRLKTCLFFQDQGYKCLLVECSTAVQCLCVCGYMSHMNNVRVV